MTNSQLQTFNQGGPPIGSPVDIAAFANFRYWTGTQGLDLCSHDIEPDSQGRLHPVKDPESGEWHLGLEWDIPHDVWQVVVDFNNPQSVRDDLRVQYWQKNWPTPAPERKPGAARGWIGRDDPAHGWWTTARGEKYVQGAALTFTCDPLDLAEAGGRAAEQLTNAEHYLAGFRRTLKLRLVWVGAIEPDLAGFQVYSGSTWVAGSIDLRFGIAGKAGGDWSGRIETSNGSVCGFAGLGFGPEDQIVTENAWHCVLNGGSKGVAFEVAYADCAPTAPDQTILTVHTAVHSFSFRVSDLDQGPIYIPDYDVYLHWRDSKVDFGAFQEALAAAPRAIYDRIDHEPEHSLERAMAEIPPLDPTLTDSYGRYLPLAVEAGRQEFAVRYNGELFADKRLLKLSGRDAAQLLWPGQLYRFRFGTGDPPDFREHKIPPQQSVLDGWLPVVKTHWLDREIEFDEEAFVALLDGPMTEAKARRGDENVAALLRFAIRNTTASTKVALLWIAIDPHELITLREGYVIGLGRLVPSETLARQWRVDPYPSARLRAVIHPGGRGDLNPILCPSESAASSAVPNGVLYRVELQGGEAHSLTLTVPFVTLIGEADWTKVAVLDYAAKRAEVVDYWTKYVQAGASFNLPDPILTDFHKAARVHVAISVDKEPVTGLVLVPAATWAYGACGNESCWQITMLDQAGHHDQAETYLETFLATQGVFGMDGRFVTQEGALQALDLDDGTPVKGHFSYNLDHGFVMECLANHYRYTGNRAWLLRVAPKLVAACEFAIRERERTKSYQKDQTQALEWGLLPAGHLEDNPEWRHWLAVNAHAYLGMKRIAEVLAEIDQLEAERLGGEAEKFRQDIRQAACRAMIASPVVKLLDGTYIPHLPTRTGLQGRELGWIREAAYGPLHLLEGEVFDPNEREMTWVLKDLEDNLFPSRNWGRAIDLERFWFCHAGITIQPNLMDLGIDYLRRGQIKHGLRALFNNFGASLYPDVRAFTEHAVIRLGHGVGPFYKSPDESKALVWLRAFLLHEQEDVLWIAPGAPRAWFAAGQRIEVHGAATFFGPVSYQIHSQPNAIEAFLEAPQRRPPAQIWLHLRHPHSRPMQSVEVNGEEFRDFDPGKDVIRLPGTFNSLSVKALFG